ncbi:hypothetical protein SPRG_00294 [Saprolegnia parasitica CBS 223.65]|uniref:Potassium channel domain-containing protein n=1 Tax=Saprolegnia parasitica (strain CBS 223.65) TaxID=695850 RepID=A0A067D9W8_SAPPC|nr:hypothetical protein SPRG_00294 [Saprolegnia parasitica CBS 223.65]KDO35446.1 hypothetical protein SPRG_00294 [Saprolegnia parasitica CBS 223.65]|eukprot:XP_012193786.1 hypothetical protein SPRG_00294 [Saprolegnia parasitica CBS 223.65]
MARDVGSMGRFATQLFAPSEPQGGNRLATIAAAARRQSLSPDSNGLKTKKVQPVNFSRFRALESRVGEWRMDSSFRQHNVLMLINAMFGLALAIAELELSWEGPHDAPSHEAVGESLRSTILKAIISLSTLLLLWQLVRLHQMMSLEKKLVWGEAFKMRYWTTEMTLRAFSEGLLLAVHPPPYTSHEVLEAGAIFMLLRFYLVVRVVRDHSMVYRKRKDIVEQHFKATPAPRFNWWLTTQIVFQHTPGATLLAFTAWCIAAFGLATYFSERDANPETFTLVNSTWYAYTAFLTLDFEEYIVSTDTARVITCLLILAGIVLNTLVVVAILDNISLDAKGKIALAFVYRAEAHDAIRAAAGAFIVTWLRWKRAQRTLLTAAEWRSHLLKVTRALDAMRIARYKKKLTEQSLGDPVLDKLQSLDAWILQIWAKLHMDGLDLAKRETRPAPRLQTSRSLSTVRTPIAARSPSAPIDDRLPSAPAAERRPGVPAAVERTEIACLRLSQELVQRQNEDILRTLQDMLSRN